MSTHPSLRWSATQMAQAIADGTCTSEELVNAHIGAIERVNPRVNAVVQDRFATARAAAKEADAKQARGEALGPLHGVPCTIKEAFAVEGMSWTAGAPSRKGVRATENAPPVERLLNAGAIPLAVTNTSELCMWMECDNPLHGRTSSAYDTKRTSGGSSGGEGALIGSGASPFGLGSDVGGSIRIPSCFNGIFGHKPTPHSITNEGQYPTSTAAAGAFLTAGPMCRKAEDLYPLLQILADLPDRFIDPSTVNVQDITILNVRHNHLVPVDKTLLAAQDRACAALERVGCEQSTRDYPTMKNALLWWSVLLGSAQQDNSFRSMMKDPSSLEILADLAKSPLLKANHTAPALLLSLLEGVVQPSELQITRLRQQALAFRNILFNEMDSGAVMLFPTYPCFAPRHRVAMLKPIHWVYTAIWNVLGFPVTQVPLGLSADGLPQGVQVVARPGEDHLSLAVALELERQFGGWHPPTE